MTDRDELLILEHDKKTLFEESLLRTNIFSWYDFKEGRSLALVGENCPVVLDYLKGCGLKACWYSKEDFLAIQGSYDYVVLLGYADKASVIKAKASLSENGVLIAAVMNAQGMMKRAGLPMETDFVKRAELEGWLEESGIEDVNWYYPYPDYRLATEIFSERRLPKTGLVTGDFPTYEGDYLPKADVKEIFETAVSDGRVEEVMNSFLVVSGSTEANYMKFNTLRAPEYRLTTILGEDKSGRYVEKRTQGSAARGHLGAIEKNYELMRTSYNMICPVTYERISEDRVRFEFVEGRGLLDSVDFTELVLDKLVAVAGVSFDTIFSTEADNISSFETGEAFRNFFGEVDADYFLGKDALRVSNPDSIFENFIFGEKIYLIDYEWTFDFPMPVDYLKYRTLLYLYRDKKVSFDRAGVSLWVLLEAFGYTEDLVEACERLELAFQLHIHGTDLRYNYLPHYQWRVWDKRDRMEFKLRKIKNRLKKN